MSASTNKKIVLFLRYITRIGLIHGLLLYIRLHVLKSQSNVKTRFLKHPINLRKGTTDLATFDQIFVARIYNMGLKSKPLFIIDCGANVGMASIYFANKFPEASIIAIEPEASNFKMLSINCKAYPNIRVLQKAVSSHDGKMEIVDNGSGHYGFSVKALDQVKTESGNIIESISLSEVMRLFQWDRVDLLKIDIEGSEKELFSSNYESWLPKTNAIVVETHDRFRPGSSISVIKTVIKYDFEVHASHEGFYFVKGELIQS